MEISDIPIAVNNNNSNNMDVEIDSIPTLPEDNGATTTVADTNNHDCLNNASSVSNTEEGEKECLKIETLSSLELSEAETQVIQPHYINSHDNNNEDAIDIKKEEEDSPCSSRSLSPVFHLSPPKTTISLTLELPKNKNGPTADLDAKSSTVIDNASNGVFVVSTPAVYNGHENNDSTVIKAEKENIDEKAEIDKNSQIVFCQCCGCFGLVEEFYEGVYCTKACCVSYELHMNEGLDGKFKKPITPVLNKKPITPVLNKKPKLSTVVDNTNNENYSNTNNNNNNENNSSSNNSSNHNISNNISSSSSTTTTSSSSTATSGNRIAAAITNHAEFDWAKYLNETKTKSAPHRLFRQPAMPAPNPFRIGMMMEAIDPQHQSLICVTKVVDIQGYRLRLRFQGFSDAYDFWVNADSFDIFPPCWCEQNGLELQPPPGFPENFNWHQYMVEHQIEVAPRHIFAVTKEEFVTDFGVKVGMKLEAVDIRNQNLVCVATAAKVMGDRILIHFDSWDSLYDYWTDLTSPFIHPVGWCDQNNVKLTPPNDCKSDFSWEKYLREEKASALPARLFRPLPPVGFKKGFKIECVDKRNPSLIRVATIADVEEHQLNIHFDNWPSLYDYKVYELSPDIHPVGWSAHTGHPLQPPPPADGSWSSPCGVFGCSGTGHMKPKFSTHNTETYCPYASHNYKKDWILTDRLVLLERSMGHFDGSILGLEPSQKSSDAKNNSTLKSSAVKRKRTPMTSSRRKRAKTLNNSQKETSNNNHNDSQTVQAKNNNILNAPDKTETQHNKIIKIETKESNSIKSVIDETLETFKELRNPSVTMNNSYKDNLQESEKQEVSQNEIKVEEEEKEKSTKPINATDKRRPTRDSSRIRKRASLNQDSITKPTEIPSTTLPVLSVQNSNPCESNVSIVNSRAKKAPRPIRNSSVKRLSLPSLDDQDTSVSSSSLRNSSSCSSNSDSPIRSTSTSTNKIVAPTVQNASEDEGASIKQRRISLPASPTSNSFPVASNNNADAELEFPHNYALNSLQLKSIVGSVDEKTVSQWKVHRLAEFIATIPGCRLISKTFVEQLIDGESFLMLSQNDFIKVMGLGLGPAIKLSNVIRMINFNSVAATYNVSS